MRIRLYVALVVAALLVYWGTSADGQVFNCYTCTHDGGSCQSNAPAGNNQCDDTNGYCNPTGPGCGYGGGGAGGGCRFADEDSSLSAPPTKVICGGDTIDVSGCKLEAYPPNPFTGEPARVICTGETLLVFPPNVPSLRVREDDAEGSPNCPPLPLKCLRRADGDGGWEVLALIDNLSALCFRIEI